MKHNTVFILATLVAASLALDRNPIDAIPYCRVVENGFTTDANGDSFVLADYLCNRRVAFAIYHNGQDTGFNLTFAIQDGGLNGFLGIYKANYTAINPPAYGVVYDLSTDYCRGGIGIEDGTYDTVDGALSIIFDGQSYGGTTINSNLTTTCSSATASFTLGPDVLPKGLITKRTFYFPTASSEAWGRVVDEVHNPTNASIEVSIGYYNNLGSDEYTHFFNLTERCSFTADTVNITAMPEGSDNLVSFHWSSWNATLPDGFNTESQFPNGTYRQVLTEGNDDIIPYWNVTIPAGKTMTFMMVMNQGGWDVDKMHASVQDLDANPLKLYADMTEDQLTTLHNFNPCAATVPQLSNTDVTPKTACSSFGGQAEFDLTAYLGAIEWKPSVNISVTVHGSDNSVIVPNENNVISVPSGTFDVKLNFLPCALNVGQVTVTCPAAPVAPVANPTKATSSASIAISFGLASVMTFVLSL